MNNQQKAPAPKTAITPTREQDYPEWYQQVIKAADLAEHSVTRGSMVIRPWGYGIWERMQQEFDSRFKATGHENAYFPLLIPLSFLEKEASHVEGFAKECAVVTHHRLEAKDGKLIPTGKLDEPFVIRPTSETIIGESFSRWVNSYRDLPILINQWCNVLRWEMRTRLFLRTAEFLWQEGHTVHANEAEAREETLRMLEVYREVMEDVIAMPVILGEKPAHERFPGAVTTYCCEAMMQDRKALQAGTSHYLGQNFAKASNIQFTDEGGTKQFAHTTSWGVSTRLIGGLIMTHSDDDGLRLPPRLAPKHVVILPVLPTDQAAAQVLPVAEALAQELRKVSYAGHPLQVHVDKRDIRGGEKSWDWIKKGIPVRVEIGPRDIEQGSVVLYRRDKGHKEKVFLKQAELAIALPAILAEIQSNLFAQAKSYRDEFTVDTVKNFEDLKAFFAEKSRAGFVRAPWSGDPASVKLLEELKLSIRCIPFDQKGSTGPCVLTGKPASQTVIIARAY